LGCDAVSDEYLLTFEGSVPLLLDQAVLALTLLCSASGTIAPTHSITFQKLQSSAAPL